MSVTLTAVSSGSNYKQGSSYPPSSYIGNDDGGSTVYVDRQKSGATFTTDTAYVRFNGASLAGHGTVASATLRLHATTKQDDDNKYSLTCEFYDFGGSSDSGDFAEEATVPVITPVDLTGISTSAYTEIALTDLTGITTGNFGLRITLVSQSDAAPAGTNGLQITSHSGTNKPQLVVDFAPGGTPVGYATETDGVNALGRARSRGLGVASEADTVNALVRVRSRAVGSTAEADTAYPVTRRRSLTLGVVAEAEIVHPIGRARSRPVGMSLEFDGAPTIGRARSRAVGSTAEADGVLGLGRARVRGVGSVGEVDTAYPVTVDGHVPYDGQHEVDVTVETDGVYPITRARARGLGVASESETVHPVGRGRSRSVGASQEGDTATGLGRARARGVGVAAEADSVPPVGRGRARGVGVAGEADQVPGLGRARAHVLGVAREQDRALPLEGGNEVVGDDEDDPIYFHWRMS